VINTFNQFIVEPKRLHWVEVNHVLRYLCGMVNYGLSYIQGDGVKLIGLKDGDWAGNTVERKSTSSCYFILGS
jgi:hypothetical protein